MYTTSTTLNKKVKVLHQNSNHNEKEEEQKNIYNTGIGHECKKKYLVAMMSFLQHIVVLSFLFLTKYDHQHHRRCLYCHYQEGFINVFVTFLEKFLSVQQLQFLQLLVQNLH
jgi:hypothetical protein